MGSDWPGASNVHLARLCHLNFKLKYTRPNILNFKLDLIYGTGRVRQGFRTLADKGGRGAKICGRPLCMAPYTYSNYRFFTSRKMLGLAA